VPALRSFELTCAWLGLDEVETHFKEVIQPIIKKYPKVFGDIEARFCNFEQHKRMGSLIMAYSFSDPTTGTIAMMPMADMLNHVTGENNARLYFPSEDDEDSSDELAGNAKFSFGSNKKSKKGESNYDEDSLKMKTISPIKSGDELYNTYGDLSSSELLRKYGFVEPELSEFDCVDVRHVAPYSLLDMSIII
jgi:SET domain-containing protein 6